MSGFTVCMTDRSKEDPIEDLGKGTSEYHRAGSIDSSKINLGDDPRAGLTIGPK